MLFNVPTLIAFISSIVTLQDGDLILCGTPPGVGAVQAGQTMQAGMETGAGAMLGASACLRVCLRHFEGLVCNLYCLAPHSLPAVLSDLLDSNSLADGARHCSLSREIKIVIG